MQMCLYELVFWSIIRFIKDHFIEAQNIAAQFGMLGAHWFAHASAFPNWVGQNG